MSEHRPIYICRPFRLGVFTRCFYGCRCREVKQEYLFDEIDLTAEDYFPALNESE